VAEAFIRRCLAAASATGLSHELVLVDDASTDGSGALFAMLSARYVFRVITLTERRGQWRPTQVGLQNARGTR